MAYPTGTLWKHIGPDLGRQPIQETSTTQVHPLGTIAVAEDATYGVGKFIYCKGVASTAAGDLCAYDSKNGDTIRAVTGGTTYGPCGVAMSDNVAGMYGWYQIEGAGPVFAATALTDVPLYLTSTAGKVDDAVTAGALVVGLTTRAATSADYATCQIDHPNVPGLGTSGTNTVDVTLAAFGSTPAAEGAALTGQALALQPASATHPGGITAATYTALVGVRKITLSAAAEAGDAIVVTGQVTDVLGVNIASATQVLVRSLAVTDNKGDISVTAGTSRKIVNPATGENVAWIETTATGGFAVSIANDVAELTLVQATAGGAAAATLALTFA